MEWFGFWIFLSVCVAVDGWLYSKGHDGYFFRWRTPEEKLLRVKLLGLREDCLVSAVSSRVCEYGTKGCVAQHNEKAP